MVGVSALVPPAVTHAGDDEDALVGCLAIFFPLGPAMLGCAAGYAIFGSSSEGTTPKFHFASPSGDPMEPLGGQVLYFGDGARERLVAGLWKGCPPDCMVSPKLSPAKEDVERVSYYIIETKRLIGTTNFDKADWQALGHGRYDEERHTWELDWDTRGYAAWDGYVLRADFIRSDGSRQTGIGLAMPEWTRPVNR
jgi:hypothetical protein